MDQMADRLREARKAAGYSSAQSAAEAFGWNPAAYRHHENGTRGFDVDAAKRYGRAFKVNPGYLLALDAIAAPAMAAEEEELEVVGLVQAGAWRPEAVLPPSERYKVKVGPNPVKGAERFVVRIEGRSMDKTVPPGSDLECLRVAFGFVEPRPGDLVIVERHAHDLTELTCKRLDVDGDDWILRAESTLPEFSEEIRIGKPSRDSFMDAEVAVTGIVIRAYQSHFRRLSSAA